MYNCNAKSQRKRITSAIVIKFKSNHKITRSNKRKPEKCKNEIQILSSENKTKNIVSFYSRTNNTIAHYNLYVE